MSLVQSIQLVQLVQQILTGQQINFFQLCQISQWTFRIIHKFFTNFHDFRNSEAKWLKVSTFSLKCRQVGIHFVSRLTKFHRDLWSGWGDNDRRPSKNQMKIGLFRPKISPWRQNAMKKRLTAVWKEIYRRFWISNQIFDSIYGSRDIGRSLDTTLGNFGKNLNFVDEYLQNG